VHQSSCSIVACVEHTGVYPMRTSRRSSSLAIVAMAGDVLLLCEASPALDEFEATGWKVLLGLTEPFFES
jgi:hypothetical protein